MVKKYFLQKQNFFLILLFASFILINFRPLLSIDDIFWDDNHWLLHFYKSDNLYDFLNYGFFEMRRYGQGIFFYNIFKLIADYDHGLYLFNFFNILLKFFSTLLIFYLVFLLTKKNIIFSILVSIIYISNPLDHALPYISAANYRLGFFLEILSIYISVKAFYLNNFDLKRLFYCIFLTVFSIFFLIETILVFEPVRILFIYIILYNKKIPFSKMNFKKYLIKYIILYFIFTLPFIFFKIYFPPYGSFENIYNLDVYRAFDLEQLLLIKKFFFGFFLFCIKKHEIFFSSIEYNFSYYLIFILFIIFLFNIIKNNHINDIKNLPFLKYIIFFGFYIYFSQILFINFVNRPYSYGLNSTHAHFAEIGMAFIIAALIFKLFSSLVIYSKAKIYIVNISLFFLLLIISFIGIYTNHTNLAIFHYGSNKEKAFWTKFEKKFKNRMDRPFILFDIDRSKDYQDIFHVIDLDSRQDLDFHLYKKRFILSKDKKNNFQAILLDEALRGTSESNNYINFSECFIKIRQPGGQFLVIYPKDLNVIKFFNGSFYLNEEIRRINNNSNNLCFIDRLTE